VHDWSVDHSARVRDKSDRERGRALKKARDSARERVCERERVGEQEYGRTRKRIDRPRKRGKIERKNVGRKGGKEKVCVREIVGERHTHKPESTREHEHGK